MSSVYACDVFLVNHNCIRPCSTKSVTSANDMGPFFSGGLMIEYSRRVLYRL